MKVQEGLKKFKNVHEVQIGSGRFKKVQEGLITFTKAQDGP